MTRLARLLTALLATLFFALATASAGATTFTVNSTADPGAGTCDVTECTLREAIAAANADSTADQISFDLDTALDPPHPIQTASALPTITQPVTIDGTTQSDFFHSPAVQIDGTNAGAGVSGLIINASATVKALAIDNFDGAGISLTGGSSTLLGNWIGVYGPNAGAGIALGVGSSTNTIGGTGADDPNTIASSGGAGIAISSSSNTIRANSIGSDGPNTGAGVQITTGNNNVIGGTAAGDGNTIQGNTGAGVAVAAGTGNAIEGNAISFNDGLGIDLGTAGVTANDNLDPDTGANNLQNFPVLTGATNDTNAGTTTVTGTLNSIASASYRVEIFASSDCDPSNNGQGEELVAVANVNTNASGNATINSTFDTSFGNIYTATATNSSGNTSEFSGCFAAPPRLTVTKSGNGTGVVTSTPAGINCGATCFADFAFNTMVTLHATPDAGMAFAGWEGGVCTGTADCVVTMDASQEVTARFTDALFPLHLAQAIARDPSVVTGATLTAPPNGTPDAIRTAALGGYPTHGASYGIMTSGDATQADQVGSGASGSDGGPNVRGDTDYDVSILKVDLNVPAAANCLTFDFRFYSTEFPTYVGSQYNDGFIAELDTSDWTTAGSVITAPHNFAFDPNHEVMSINSTGATSMNAGNASDTGYGGGTDPLHASTVITSGPHSLYLSIFDQGDDILDTAALLDNLTLSTRDAGACASGATSDNTAPVVTLTTPANGSSTADTTPTYSGAAGTAPGDLGTITVKIYAGATATGSPVQTLTTTQAAGAWTVDGTTPLAPGTYTAQAQQSDSSGNTGFSSANTFTITSPGPARTLTVANSPTAAGTITSSVGAINCGATCTDDYADGTGVTLTPTPAAGYRFGSWSGACTGSAGCTVTMNANKSVTATYVKIWNLTVSKSGNGSGSVSSSPAGISCGATCTASFDDATLVTLTPTPATGSTFTGWTGACTGSAGCTITMDQARAVTATFALETHDLAVAKSGSGSGTVSSSPGAINCGATCSGSYDYGTSVTVSASAAAGSRFTGWSGACTGAGTCSVTMDANKSVTANFVSVFDLTVSKAGTGSGSVSSSPVGINCGAACSASYDDGSVITLTAAAASGSTFAGWSGDCTGTGTCTVTMSAARNVTATFNTTPTDPPLDPPGGPGGVGAGDLFCGAQHRGHCTGLKVKDTFDRPGNASWTFDAFNPSPGNGGGKAAAAGKKIRLGQIKKKITKAGTVTVVFKLKAGAKTNKLYKQVKKAKLKSVLVTVTFTDLNGKKRTATKTVKLKR